MSTKRQGLLTQRHCNIEACRIPYHISLLYLQMLRLIGSIPVAARSKAWVCGHSLSEIAGSNPATGGTDICLLLLLPGTGRRERLITHPEESYRVWCVEV